MVIGMCACSCAFRVCNFQNGLVAMETMEVFFFFYPIVMRLEDQVGNGFSLVEFVFNWINMGRHGRDRMVVGFTTTYMQSVLVSLSPLTSCVQIPLRRGAVDTTWCDKVCRWLVAGRWFSPGSPVSSTTDKPDRRDITEILLKVTLNTIIPNLSIESILSTFYILYYVIALSPSICRQNGFRAKT